MDGQCQICTVSQLSGVQMVYSTSMDIPTWRLSIDTGKVSLKLGDPAGKNKQSGLSPPCRPLKDLEICFVWTCDQLLII